MLSPYVNVASNHEFSDNAVLCIHVSLLLSYYFIIIHHLYSGHSQLLPEPNTFLMCILLQLLCGYNLCYM